MTGFQTCVVVTVVMVSMLTGILFGVSAIADTALPPISVRAGICTDKPCNRRSQAAFEPATIAVEARVRQDDRNRKLFIGVSCDGGLDSDPSEIDLDGVSDRPLYTRAYAGMPPGECVAWAAVLRSDGTRDIAMSSTMLIISRQ